MSNECIETESPSAEISTARLDTDDKCRGHSEWSSNGKNSEIRVLDRFSLQTDLLAKKGEETGPSNEYRTESHVVCTDTSSDRPKDDWQNQSVKRFQIAKMSMRDGETNELLWESNDWTADMWKEEQEAFIPSRILDCAIVSREISFFSEKQISNLKLIQRFMFKGTCIEEWVFDFGFVIPGSTNSWQQKIQAAGKNNMMSPDALSGNVTVETSFYDGTSFLAKSSVRIFYS
mmetsp:Transcript_9344/g.13896  ORF Transcript_9344/g.13896 Transcript_9344/m.13896 type:complete len:232 (-) Transcript_9344:861-1556(-)